MTTPSLNLMKGKTTHTRLAPFRHAFFYSVTMMEIDVRRPETAAGSSKWFSLDKFNLTAISSYRTCGGKRTSLEAWAEQKFASHGIATDECSIRLITFPRVLGYAFSPLSLWLLLENDGSLRGMIYEVNNTFGDDHSYVAKAIGHESVQEADKTFYVSPFMDVSGKYRFHLRHTDEALSLSIENMFEAGRAHVATLNLTRDEATDRSLFRFALLTPFAGVGVITAIHWQALKLWLKGARYHSRKQKTNGGDTPARTLKTTKDEWRNA